MTERKLLIALDFDGVIHSYMTGWQGADVAADPPTPGALDFIRRLVDDDRFEVTIFSSRLSRPNAEDTIRDWFIEHGLEDEVLEEVKFDRAKPPAHMSIDDRGYRFLGQFPELDEIAEFKPWNRKIEQDLGTQLRNMRRDAVRNEDELKVPRIGGCVRCGGVHEDITIHKFQRYEGNASHYTFCPETGEPMIIQVMLQEDFDAEEE